MSIFDGILGEDTRQSIEGIIAEKGLQSLLEGIAEICDANANSEFGPNDDVYQDPGTPGEWSDAARDLREIAKNTRL